MITRHFIRRGSCYGPSPRAPEPEASHVHRDPRKRAPPRRASPHATAPHATAPSSPRNKCRRNAAAVIDAGRVISIGLSNTSASDFVPAADAARTPSGTDREYAQTQV